MRRLPVLVERSVREAQAVRTDLASRFDRSLQTYLLDHDTQVSCRKGCHHCCYYPVVVSVLEGVALYRSLVDHGVWSALKSKIQETSAKTWDLPLEVWALSEIPCPLLTKAGECSSYTTRPFACRITVSMQDPEDCKPHRVPQMESTIPRRILLEALSQQETGILRRHRIPNIRLPLATALLFGERVASGSLEIEEVAAKVWEEHQEK